MDIHIGKKVQEKVEELRLTQKQFGDSISRNEKTVPDIYDRKHMSTDLLLRITKALNEDLFRHFYEEDETLKRLRKDEVSRLNDIIESQNEQIKLLQKELSHLKELSETQKGYLESVKEQLIEYKRKVGYDPENKSYQSE